MPDYRIDIAHELDPPVRTPEGFLLVSGIMAKPGVYLYGDGNGGTVRELVTAEVLQDAEYLGTVGRGVFTLDHPSEFVTTKNVDAVGVGDVDGEVERLRQGYVKIKGCIRSDRAVKAVDGGVRELSAGYTVDVDHTPGVHPTFGRYDQRQTKRWNNHIALVPRGRHGAEASLRIDGAGDVPVLRYDSQPAPTGEPSSRKKVMAKLTINGVEYADVDPALAQAVQAEKAALQGRADAAGEQLKAATAELNALKADAPKGEQKADADGADRLDWFNRRQTLLGLASTHKLDGADKLDNEQLTAAVVKACGGDPSKGPAYCDSYLDFVASTQKSGEATKQKADAVIGTLNAAGAPAAEKTSKQKYDEARRRADAAYFGTPAE